MAVKPIAHEHCKHCGACLIGLGHKCAAPSKEGLTERDIDILDTFLALTARATNQ